MPAVGRLMCGRGGAGFEGTGWGYLVACQVFIVFGLILCRGAVETGDGRTKGARCQLGHQIVGPEQHATGVGKLGFKLFTGIVARVLQSSTLMPNDCPPLTLLYDNQLAILDFPWLAWSLTRSCSDFWAKGEANGVFGNRRSACAPERLPVST